jgi:hypothetical protein
MGRKSVLLLMISVILLVWAIPVFAQPEAAAAPAEGKSQWLIIASAFGMALAAAGCGYAQSRGFARIRTNESLIRVNPCKSAVSIFFQFSISWIVRRLRIS